MITREFKLYLNAGTNIAPVINANQFDQDEEWIFTLLTEDGTVYTPSTSAIIGLKTDGTTILNAGTVNSSGQVVITETEQMTAVPGSNVFELLIDGNTHGTANFVVFVEKRPGDIDNPSESDISLFQEAITAAGNVTQFQSDVENLQSDVSNLQTDTGVLSNRIDQIVVDTTTNLSGLSVITLRGSTTTGSYLFTIPDSATILDISYALTSGDTSVKRDNISYTTSISGSNQLVNVTVSGVSESCAINLSYSTVSNVSIPELADIRVGADGTTYSTAGDAVRGQVGILKSDVTNITGNPSIAMSKGYIVTSTTNVDVTNVIDSNVARYAVINVNEGDVFTINAHGTSNARAYAIIEEDGTLIENAGSATLESNRIITIPSGASKLVINDVDGLTSYYGKVLVKKVDNLIETIKALDINWESGSLASSSGRITANTKRIRTQYIPVTSGNSIVFIFKEPTVLAYFFWYSDATYNSYLSYVQITESGMYTIPENAKYLRVVIGSSENIDTSFAKNVYISNPDILESVHLTNLNGESMTLSFNSGYYKRVDDIYATSGDWGYSNNIECSYGDYLLVKNSYATDFRNIFFYDANNICTGLCEGEKNAKIDSVLVQVPENTNYCIINTKYSERESTTVNVIKSNLVMKSDSAIKSVHTIMADTGYKINTIFKHIKEVNPLFTIVDDDGRNLAQVTNFHDVCVANGIVGCNALATKFIEDMSDSDRETFISTLKQYETQGFENVLHCYNHDYWESSIKSSMTPEQLFSVITSDLVTGIRDMEEYGFINWRHWIVPQGKTDLPNAEKVARNLGFRAAYDVANNTFNRFIPRDRTFHRYNVPRMELYSNDTYNPGHTLQLIKDQADICKREGGWLIVCTHFYQQGWTTDDPTFSRVSEMIQYIMNLGFVNVTLSGGMSYWEDIYRMYDLF